LPLSSGGANNFETMPAVIKDDRWFFFEFSLPFKKRKFETRAKVTKGHLWHKQKGHSWRPLQRFSLYNLDI
jgi:hypothetical protein